MADGGQQVPPTGTQGGAPQARDKAETFDAEYVKKLREEAADHRTKKVAAEAELKKLQDAQLSDAEKASKRLAELEAAVFPAHAGVNRSPASFTPRGLCIASTRGGEPFNLSIILTWQEYSPHTRG